MNKSFLCLTASLNTATALALLAATQAVAQDDEPMWTQLRTVHVKPGRNTEFAELQKELGAALKAADRPPRLIYQEIRGDVGVFMPFPGLPAWPNSTRLSFRRSVTKPGLTGLPDIRTRFIQAR